MSKRYRRGLFWLLVFGVLVAFTPRILISASSDDTISVSVETIIQAHDNLIASQEKKEQEQSEWKNEPSRYHVPAQKFDPNTYTIEDWMKLGLSQKQSEVVVNFSKRGLSSNDDLGKIFVFPIELLEIIKDSTVYPIVTTRNTTTKEIAEEVLVHLNIASHDELLSIPGIGNFYAGKIIERRTQLGGFVSREQLLELWKFDAVKLAEIEPYIQVDPSLVNKLDINHASIDELRTHPYISYAVANSIVKMRLHEPYTKIEDIKRSVLIDEELFMKIQPYLIAL